ncbi:unnamed protein product [Sphenostylis stenocarpa]|uniref:Uncharacterized protein n=1 Tax=Sphenostylis stenocarpa TaxID=92480 RepID=A0AA86TG56_9FABA|nr:unnamed protein product [Sphenostylis stenocarpa]
MLRRGSRERNSREKKEKLVETAVSSNETAVSPCQNGETAVSPNETTVSASQVARRRSRFRDGGLVP